MTGWLTRLFGSGVPAGFAGTLAAEENVLGSAEVSGGGVVLASSLGLWIPDAGEVRRIGWHLISKATWSGGALSVIEAVEEDIADDTVLIVDLPPRQFVLERPGPVPRVVQARVTGSIRSRHHRELPGGGAWFVQRKLPGVGRIVLQVRPDPGTDPSAVRLVATEVAERIRLARGVP